MIKINKKSNNKKGNDKAITLIALVVTIIILLILAGVAVGFATNGSGLFDKAKHATEKYNNSVDKENYDLAKLGNETNNLSSSRADTQASGNPTGTIISFAADNPPEGYLECNGQEVSRTTYSQLFEVIGTKYGEGDGSTTFNVPDLQGEFLRGAGSNSHTNQGSGANVGIHQDSTYLSGSVGGGSSTSAYIFGAGNWTTPNNFDRVETQTTEAAITTQSKNQNRIVGGTIRPTNTSVLYCIKF